MSETRPLPEAPEGDFDRRGRYEAMMEVMRTRMTNRAFPPHAVPREHFVITLEGARHAPLAAIPLTWRPVFNRPGRVRPTTFALAGNRGTNRGSVLLTKAGRSRTEFT